MVRLLLLLVLVAGVVNVLPSLRQQHLQEEDLLADLAAGRVSYLRYERGGHQVHWVDDWWSWKQTTVVTWEDTSGGSTGAARSPDQSAQSWLYRQVDALPRRVWVEVDDDGGRPARWLHMISWRPLRAATVLAWWLSLLLMLSRRDHRYANRWAWFWLFLFGQAGALLYLTMEPHLAWRPPSPSDGDRAPIQGGAGCAWSLLLSIAISLVGVGISVIPY